MTIGDIGSKVIQIWGRFALLTLVVSIATALLAWGERFAILRAALQVWATSDRLVPADAVVILGGSNDDRSYAAAELYRSGLADRMLLVPLGVMFNVTSHFAASAVRQGDWIYTPVLFLNLKIALSVDNFYVAVVGTFAISCGMYLVLKFTPFDNLIPFLSSAKRA
jgi:hypothetical protein